MLVAVQSIMQELAPWLFLGALVSGLMHAFLPPRFIASQLRGIAGVFKAVAFGVPLPLCSCGVIPAGVGLKKDGASDGSSLGFLISTPQTGVDSILVAAGFLGWPFALFKVVSAGFLGVVGGLLAHRFGEPAASIDSAEPGLGQAPGLIEGFWHAVQVLRSIWAWVVVGVVVSALITLFAPTQEIHALAQRSPWMVYGGVLALSVPLYVCATASVPIAAALVAGGLPAGSALVFLIAGPATNMATIGAVGRTFGKRLLGIYLGTLVVGSLALGLAFDHLLPPANSILAHHHHGPSWWQDAFAGVLTLVFVAFAVEALRARFSVKGASMKQGWVVTVDGMTCGGCSSRLERVLSAHPGIDQAQVDLQAAEAVVTGLIGQDDLRAAITGAGFDPGEPNLRSAGL
jgi:uncharacterized membrane protein YraQ (UPF0718 family)/copper chaperone CopZ